MDWTRVSVVVDGEAAEAVAEALRPFAHGGVSLEQTAADMSPEASLPGLDEQITVSIYLPRQADIPAQRRRIQEVIWHLGQLYPIPAPSFHTVREEDWANAWKQHFVPFPVGRRFLICPAWQSARVGPEQLLVLMDPGMAFGTGLHPTTRMCLEAMEQINFEGAKVLDLGTGSGILAIAAILLGASRVLALDADEIAVKSARRNSTANGVGERVAVRRGSLPDLHPTETWDVVLVNILAPVILQMLDGGLGQRLRPGGQMILSGIIDNQVPEVQAAMERAGLVRVGQRQIKDWITLIGRPRKTQ